MSFSYLLTAFIILGTVSAIGVSIWAGNMRNGKDVEEQLTEFQKQEKSMCESKKQEKDSEKTLYWNSIWKTCTTTLPDNFPSGVSYPSPLSFDDSSSFK